MEITKHFTATTVVVYKNKALLHLHKKLHIWLPVGGHIDRDELPHLAALREIKEESGLADVTLYNPHTLFTSKDVVELIPPVHILLENINPFHQHIDFIYFAVSQTDKVQSDDGETDDLVWLTKEEVAQKDNTPENAKMLCKEALELLGGK